VGVRGVSTQKREEGVGKGRGTNICVTELRTRRGRSCDTSKDRVGGGGG